MTKYLILIALAITGCSEPGRLPGHGYKTICVVPGGQVSEEVDSAKHIDGLWEFHKDDKVVYMPVQNCVVWPGEQ